MNIRSIAYLVVLTMLPLACKSNWGDLGGKPDEYLPAAHDHDLRYYPKSVADSKFALLSALDSAIGKISALESQVNSLINSTGFCPTGYARTDDASVRATGFVCKRGADEMVKAGDFWIDRYETVVVDQAYYNSGACDNPGSAGVAYGQVNAPDWSSLGYPGSGNWSSPLHACSVRGVTPSSNITWFQAQQACGLSGKHLCTNEQWQLAAAGTDISECNTGGAGEDGYRGVYPEATGSLNGPAGTGCLSNWGVYDMVGNLWELTAMWQGHPGWNGAINIMSAEFGTDGYWAGGPRQIEMAVIGTTNSWRPVSLGFEGGGTALERPYGPAMAARGGNYVNEGRAGVFALDLTYGPSGFTQDAGARCCRNR